MPRTYSLPEIYDEGTKLVADEPFTVWLSGAELRPGQLCEAGVWYEETHKWALEEAHFDQRDEQNATWYARKVRSGKLPEPGTKVKRYFSLSGGEVLLTVNGKYRPVVPLKRFDCEWVYPGGRSMPTWIVFPLFSYRPRHAQIILADARLSTPERFYMPTARGELPGTLTECAARFLTIQGVREQYLEPVKTMDPGKKMSRPYGLTQTALKLLTYHLFKGLGLFAELLEQRDKYDLFKQYVNELIDAGVQRETAQITG